MFQVNDYVIYGVNGVCMVKEIGSLNISGSNTEKLYYTLEPLYSKGSLVYTPVDNQKVIMRDILSKDEAWELIDDIPNIETIEDTDDKNREALYKESMKKNDCREWIRIIKTVNIKKQERIAQGKKIVAADEKYYRIAEDGLYGEFAISLGIPKDEVEEFIIARVE